jgi:hypothetical protein
MKTIKLDPWSDVKGLTVTDDRDASNSVLLGVQDDDTMPPENTPLTTARLLPGQAVSVATALLDAAGKGWMMRAARHAHDYYRDTGICMFCTIGGDDAPNKASHEDFCPLSRVK